MNKQEKVKIEIAGKLENKSEAYTKMKIAEKNRKQYLDTYIKKINRKIEDAVRMGCNFIKVKIDLMNTLDNKIVLYKCFTEDELNGIIEHFIDRGYKVNFELCNVFDDIQKIRINIDFSNIK